MCQLCQIHNSYPEFRGILRKINEKPDSYEYITHSSGHKYISYPYLTLMGLMTPNQLRKSSESLWTDGFFARFLVAFPTRTLYKDLTTFTNTEKQKRQNQPEEKMTRILKKETKPMTVPQIARKTGNSAKYRMSHQDVVSTLATLSDSGLAAFELKGNKQYWSLVPDSD